MADVFISYSRRDSEFVQRLNNAFVNSGRVVWIDWQSIPRGEDWWGEIQQGIEGAEGFICVITEHWLTSEICQREIEHARKHNKRILPVIRQPIEDEVETRVKGTWMDQPWESLARDQWTYLRHLNWVRFDDDMRFDAEFSELLEALDEDQPHIKAHTRYQVRALEWERSKRNPSFLLAGDDLDFAEAWLHEADEEHKSPEATTIQRAYITESRRVEDARLAADALQDRQIKQFQRAAVALGAFFVLALIASGVLAKTVADTSNQAATARQQVVMAGETLTPVAESLALSNTQVATASTQVAIIAQTLTPIPATLTKVASQIDDGVRRAESLRLAALSRDQEWGDIATLLAIRALKTHYSLQADVALQSALERFSRPFFTDTCGVNSTAISPDSNLVAVAGGSANIQLFDFATGNLVGTMAGTSEGILQVKFSADSHWLVSAHEDGIVRLWDVASKQAIMTFSGHTGIVYAVDISPDGKQVLSGGADRTVRLWDVSTGKEIRQFATEEMLTDFDPYSMDQVAIMSAGFVPKHTNVYASLGLTNLRLFALNCTGGGGGGGGGSNSIAEHEFVRLWDTTTGTVVRRFSDVSEATAFALSVRSSLVASDGTMMVAVTDDGKIHMWVFDGTKPSPAFPIGTLEQPLGAAISPDGQVIAVTNTTGAVSFFQLPYGGTLGSFEAVPDSRGAPAIYAPDGTQILVTGTYDTSQSLRLITLTGVHPSPPLYFPYGFLAMGIVAGGDEQVLTMNNTKAELWDWKTGKQTRTFAADAIDITDSSVWNNAISRDGRVLAVTYTGTDLVGLWEIATGKLLHQLAHGYGNVYMLDFSPDNRYLATISASGPVRVWSLADGSLLHEISLANVALNGMKFSADGRGLWVGDKSGFLHLIDLESEQEKLTLKGGSVQADVLSLGVAPDGSMIVDSEGVIHWLDGREQAQLAPVESALTNIRFSPDGRWIAAISGARSTTIHIWNAATHELARNIIESGSIRYVEFSSDSKYLFVAHDDTARGSAHISRIIRIPVDYHTLMDIACSALTRDVPDVQRSEFQINSEATCP